MRSIPEVASPAVQVTADEELGMTAPFAGPTMETVGAVASTDTATDTRTVFPARSKAFKSSVWLPSERPVNVYVAVPAATVTGVPPSRRTSKWSMPEVASDAVHVSWTELVPKSWPGAGAVRDAVGAAVSTVTATDKRSVFPARSKALKAKVWLPSESPV